MAIILIIWVTKLHSLPVSHFTRRTHVLILRYYIITVKAIAYVKYVRISSIYKTVDEIQWTPCLLISHDATKGVVNGREAP